MLSTSKTKKKRATMILITGATGQLGTAVVKTLLEKASANQIAALVRDESKAATLEEQGVDIRVGSYDDPTSIDRAMQGIEKVLLISGTDEDSRHRLQQHQNVVDTAKKVGVQCITYTSQTLKDRKRMTLANQLMEVHFQTEDYIKASGLNYTIFRNILYMDAIPQLVGGEKVFETGIYFPAGHGRVPFALRSEMGEAIAHVMLESGCSNRIYNLTGSESYSFDDVAATLAELSGKEVNYTPAEEAVYEAQMKERGVPSATVQKIVGFLTDIKNGQEEEVSPDMENLIGRKPASLKEGLRVLFSF
jgi:NAD(P)H dehydrogenase (quinone)